MKRIAVTYDNGQIFQHFGRTEQFKVYEVENNEIVSAEVIGNDGAGHEALASLLSGKQIDVLICGGIGAGAVNALASQGIELCAGASGDADAAVCNYLAGDLVNTGSNCDHHDHEEGHTCGHHEGGCGGHCGGGCHSVPQITGKNVGKRCKTHYKGTFNDGVVFDSSYTRGEPLEFICGVGEMIPGYDQAVADMEVGETINIHLMPEQAYGPKDPTAIFTVLIEQLPGSEELGVGEMVYLYAENGMPFPVTVVAKDEATITLDANHEMAGKELNFEITLVEIEA